MARVVSTISGDRGGRGRPVLAATGRAGAVGFVACLLALTVSGVTLDPTHGANDATSEPGVTISRIQGGLRVELGDALFAEYHDTDVQKPYLYPLLGPGGEHVTRGWPITDRPDETHDHPHHTSAWFAHGDVNGHDFWHGGHGERTVPDGAPSIEITDDAGVIRAKLKLIDGDDAVVATERRVMRFTGDDDSRAVDFDSTMIASHGDITFGDTKEGTFALRLAPTLRLVGDVAQGNALNSTGDRDGACWGKRAKWMAYWGPVEGNDITVAVFDHPENPHHPTWWHARDYGLFAANPFGVHDFEGKPPRTGDFTVKAGESVRFRYRVLIHAGVLNAEQLESAFDDFTHEDWE